MIQEIYSDMSFIIAFMVLCLIVSMSFGEKALRYFLLTTLFSIAILNVNNFIAMLQGNPLNNNTQGSD